MPGKLQLAATARAKGGVPDERLVGDVAGAAVFLASAASDFVTGAALPVDGGYSSFMA